MSPIINCLIGDKCKKGVQLRPYIVWFSEGVPMIEKAVGICETANTLIITRTSMHVYPAASLLHCAPQNKSTYVIDPRPNIGSRENLTVIAKTATVGVTKFIELFTT